ncbi:hypothetical protein EDD22DRAFT_596161 [Suillus occidentalis]|nr:hypothetical protein EDD22DRAFT_596161 [Suillus occidentalis]
MRICSILLLPVVADDGVSMEIAALSALALGFVSVGSGNGEITSRILQTLMERDDAALDEKWRRFMALGLALLYVAPDFKAGTDSCEDLLLRCHRERPAGAETAALVWRLLEESTPRVKVHQELVLQPQHYIAQARQRRPTVPSDVSSYIVDSYVRLRKLSKGEAA